MDGRYVEPRKVMWAMAEIIGQDDTGTSFRVPAILEDTSISGACVRIKRPLAVGSRITIKWHREQFSATARNCRREGGDFILGVRREAEIEPEPERLAENSAQTKQATVAASKALEPSVRVSEPEHAIAAPPAPAHSHPVSRASFKDVTEKLPSHPRNESHTQGTSPGPERKVMQPKMIFPHFWRRQQDGDAPAKSTITEAPVNKPSAPEQTPSGPRGELLSYEDIYRAVGIMSPGSGYGIHKVVEMLNSDRIRDLSGEVKRASVLMALDAAGISADELLTDATRRQNALASYEAGQVKQLEDFEARKGKDNARIEEEMEKVRAHYAQRVQANLDRVAKEKEALRNWQMAMQHETQRIAEVIELCGKQAAPPQNGKSLAAAAGAQGSEKLSEKKAEKSELVPAAGTTPLRPTLLSGH